MRCSTRRCSEFWLLKAPEKKEQVKPNCILAVFRPLLLKAMRWRWITIAITLACFVISLLALPLVPRQFFPASDRPELVVDLTSPQNASIFASDQAATRLDTLLKDNPDVASWSTYIGRGAIRFYLPLNVQLNNDFFAQAVVVAKDVAARKRLQAALEKKLAEELPGVVSRVSPLELGPPVGWPVQYRVSGPDLSQVRAISLQLGQILGSDHNLRGINFDWMEPARKVRIEIDQDQARLLGLSSQVLSSYMNTVMTGAPITQVRDDIYLVDVVARAQDEQRVSLDTMQALQVPLPSGRTVPLSQIARFEFSQEYPLIWRRDRVPTLTVQADVVPGSTPEAAVASLAPGVEKLEAGLPAGYRIAVGGTVEESASSQASVYAMVPAMLFLMLLFLMAQLHSFSRLAMVLSLVPMGLIGIVAALLISGRPLGFRRDPRDSGPDGHDRAQCGHSHRADRGRACTGAGALGCGSGRRGVPLPAYHADSDIDRSWLHSDRAHGVLGADGLRHHGGSVRGDASDPDCPAGTLRHFLARPGAGG